MYALNGCATWERIAWEYCVSSLFRVEITQRVSPVYHVLSIAEAIHLLLLTVLLAWL